MLLKSIAAGSLLCVATASLAVGDPPVKLDRRQAAAEYVRIRPLLENDGRACPVGQSPVSGLVRGGASPAGGSRTTTIAFDKGAVVRIVRSWSGTDAASASSRFTVTCDTDPATGTVAADEITGGVDAADRCRPVAGSLREATLADCRITPVAAATATAGDSDSDYLQQRAAALESRIAAALSSGRLSRASASALRRTVGRVQTLAGNLQTRDGTIQRADADRMNQQLTDVERALPTRR